MFWHPPPKKKEEEEAIRQPILPNNEVSWPSDLAHLGRVSGVLSLNLSRDTRVIEQDT